MNGAHVPGVGFARMAMSLAYYRAFPRTRRPATWRPINARNGSAWPLAHFPASNLFHGINCAAGRHLARIMSHYSDTTDRAFGRWFPGRINL